MASNDLKQTCQKYQKALDQPQVGVASASEAISLENEIMELKEIEKFIDSKIKLIRVTDTSHIPIKDLNLEVLQSQLTEKMLKLQTMESATRFTLTGHIIECLKNRTTKDIAFQIYKQKVLKQLEKFENNCEIIHKSYTERQQAIDTNTHFALRFRTQVVFAELLKNKKQNDKQQTNRDEEHGEHMERVNQRLLKINFMRILMNRLLYCADLKKYPEFKEIWKNGRYPVTIDSLLKK